MFKQMLNMHNLKKYPISILSPKGLSAVSIEQPLNNAKSGLYIMKEIWEDVKGYKGYYQVSTLGMMKSLRRNILLKLSMNNKGYLSVYLSKNRIVKKYLVHRLVGFAFVPNPENKPQINHKNGIKTDNRVKNIEWRTCKENIHHAWATGLSKMSERQKIKTSLSLRGSKSASSVLTESDIPKIRYLKKEGKTNIEIGVLFNVHRRTIGSVIRKITWSHVPDESVKYIYE